MVEEMTPKELKGWQQWAKDRMEYTFDEWQEANR